MIRVLQVIPDMGGGGAERIVVHLASQVDRDRFHFGVLSLFGPWDTPNEAALLATGAPVKFLGKRVGFDARMFTRIFAAVRALRPDVLHTHRYVLRYLLPTVAALRIPVIHTIHNTAEHDDMRSLQWIDKLSYRLGVQPVSIANEVTASMERVYGIKSLPLVLNGIPVSDYARGEADRLQWRERSGFAPSDFLFVNVARLVRQKNPLLLLDAFAAAFPHDRRAHLLYVGAGDLRDAVEQKSRELGIAARVHLLGNRSDVPDILAACDIFSLSSDWEGNPLAVMEAMAAGKPIVGTTVGGVPELVADGITGRLVPPGDTVALAAAMRAYFDDPASVARDAERARAVARDRFDVSHMVRAYEALYSERARRLQPASPASAGERS